MNMNRNNNPGPNRSASPLAYVLLFTGIALLVGVLVFGVTIAILQRSHSNTPQANVTATSTTGGSIPVGTVQPSKTGPYGFTILRNFTPDTVTYFKELGVTW